MSNNQSNHANNESHTPHVTEELPSQQQNEANYEIDGFALKTGGDPRKINNTPSLINMIEKYLNDNYHFRYNMVTSRIEYNNLIDDSSMTVLDERGFNSILRKLIDSKFKVGADLLDIILRSDFVPEYDPFDEYFNKLVKWDGKIDYISLLADTVKTTNQGFWRKVFKKWLVATVSCALKGRENHEVLVFCGKQGIGKSTWLNKLLPEELKQYSYSGTINPNNKDTLINMAETMFLNLDELENLNKNELGELKHLLTHSDIRLRRPYARYHEIFKRRASFMGSINDSEFLTDTTGNRRYLCLTIDEIEYTHNINMDLVFAQAYSLFKYGENGQNFVHWFAGDDLKEVELNNEDYRRRSAEEELIIKYFEVPQDIEDVKYMTPTDILAHINSLDLVKLNPTGLRRLGSALQKLGFKKKTIENTKPYMVKLKSSNKQKYQSAA